MRFIRRSLTEDIDSVKRRYPMIDDETFAHILALDPTHREGSSSIGKYTKWMLELVKQGKFEEDVDYVTRDGEAAVGHVEDLLREFENKKAAFTNKDIGQFKSVQDLADGLASVGDVQLTARQKERRLRNSKDYEQVFSGRDFDIYTPTTYAGSCTLGKGTKWCTAYSESSMSYDNYVHSGPLYVLISKHNPSEKYQFHFPSKSFMDADDKPIDKDEFFEKYPDVAKFFDEQLDYTIFDDDRYHAFVDHTLFSERYEGQPYAKIQLKEFPEVVIDLSTPYSASNSVSKYDNTDKYDEAFAQMRQDMRYITNQLKDYVNYATLHNLFLSLQWFTAYMNSNDPVEIDSAYITPSYLNEELFNKYGPLIVCSGMDYRFWINPEKNLAANFKTGEIISDNSVHILPYKPVLYVWNPESTVNADLQFGRYYDIEVPGIDFSEIPGLKKGATWTYVGMYKSNAVFICDVPTRKRYNATECITAINQWESAL